MCNHVTKEQARALAIRYEAFQDAVNNGSVNSQNVWAKMMLDIQEETGIILVREQTLKFYANRKGE